MSTGAGYPGAFYDTSQDWLVNSDNIAVPNPSGGCSKCGTESSTADRTQHAFLFGPNGLGAAAPASTSNTTLILVGLASAGVIGWAIWKNRKGRRR